MYTEVIVARNQLSWLRFSSPFWGNVGLVSTINTLEVHLLRPFRFTPIIYHVSFSTTVGTARIAHLVLWRRQWVGWLRNLDLILVGGKKCICCSKNPDWMLCPTQLPLQWVQGTLFRWGKVMGHETDTSPQSILCSTFVWDFWLSISACIVIRQLPRCCSQYIYIGCSVTFKT
jgi:hypothetical protein